MALHLKIITPMSTPLDSDVLSITLQGIGGEMEILPDHTDMISSNGNGELSYRLNNGETHSIFIGAGFIQVEANQVLLVTDTALQSDEIDVNSIVQAMERAQEVLRNQSSVLSRQEQTYLEASIAKQMAMMDYKRRR